MQLQRPADGRETADEEDENQEFIDVLNDVEELFSKPVLVAGNATYKLLCRSVCPFVCW